MPRHDAFTSKAADLKRHQRTPDGILAALRAEPRVSLPDLRQNEWLRDGVATLLRRGAIAPVEKTSYPWVGFTVKEPN